MWCECGKIIREGVYRLSEDQMINILLTVVSLPLGSTGKKLCVLVRCENFLQIFQGKIAEVLFVDIIYQSNQVEFEHLIGCRGTKDWILCS